MSSKEIAIKFSNEVYATKKDVANFMKTPMIDSIWNNIIEYRENFYFKLKLKHITNNDYVVCLTPQINQKINNIERQLLKLNYNYLKLNLNNSESYFKKISFESVLINFANKYNIQLDEFEINKIISKDVSNLRPELLIVYHYYLALEKIDSMLNDEFSINSFEIFEREMLGFDNVSLREKEIENDYSRVLINKIYFGIPCNAISKAMNNLAEFLNDENIGMLIKAVGSLYYIYYVKPYDAYSEDLAIFTFKYVLAHEGLNNLSKYLDFEKEFIFDDVFKNNFIETQKSLDLTYFLNFLLEKFDNVISNATLNINNAKSKIITNELYADEVKGNDLVPSLDDLAKDDHLEELEDKKNFSSSEGINYTKNIAIENVPSGLNEQEAQKLEKYLLEMEPNLSRGQAYFYARHCTINMNYTIAQYKKEVGCAYETARSSMDNLVRLGYYKKELLKNKFVYIPIIIKK